MIQYVVLTGIASRSMPPMPRIHHQAREPAWSQPSPTIPDYYAPGDQNVYDGQRTDVSPLSSPPRSNPRNSEEEFPVSPIEPEFPQTQRRPSANLEPPRSRIPQRIVSDKTKKAGSAGKDKEETKWDAYSGEPTRDDTGHPPTVRPGIPPVEHQYPQLKERTLQILAGLREREAATKPAWGKPPPPVAGPDPLDRVVRKEPWKGPSGRTALVEPVQNNPAARAGPIHHPQRNISRMKQPEIAERAESPAYTLRSMASEESIKPVAPLKIPNKSRNPSPQSSNLSFSPPFSDAIQSAPPTFQHPKSLQSPFSSPGPVRSSEPPTTVTTVRTDSPPNDPIPATPRTPTPPAVYYDTTPIKMQQMPSEPDVSRFSWTTYSTSVGESPGNIAHILREESPPPMPPMPRLKISKRPVPGMSGDTPRMRKEATPSQASIVPRKPVGSKARPSIDSITPELSLSKTLPQIPPEFTDKVSNLEAQLGVLAMRKHNITRIIRDLNESLKKNAIVYDMWKRKNINERITNHESELQSVTNEAHDLELRLHRARKKRDTEDFYENPTGLWIRRVTS